MPGAGGVLIQGTLLRLRRDSTKKLCTIRVQVQAAASDHRITGRVKSLNACIRGSDEGSPTEEKRKGNRGSFPVYIGVSQLGRYQTCVCVQCIMKESDIKI